MLAYSDRYRLEGNKLTTKVDVAWNQGMVGSEQVRFVRFEGDRMLIESPYLPNPNGNNSMVAHLFDPIMAVHTSNVEPLIYDSGH